VVDALEGRRMLTAAIHGRVLVIEGTPRADAIVVTRGKRAVTVDVNGRVAEFSLRSFGAIDVQSGNGDDLITLGTRDKAVVVGADISAGAGDDTVVTGDGNDTVAGGDGNDQISTHGGDDRVSGGAGHDLIFGGDGNDNLSGDGKADTLFGDYGDDLLLGGAGDDELRDGFGADTLYGAAGRDRFGTNDSENKLDATASEYTERENENYELAVTPLGALTFTSDIKPTVIPDTGYGGFEGELSNPIGAVWSCLWQPDGPDL
jgi:Ca2+-binding RTX toxin-like protein